NRSFCVWDIERKEVALSLPIDFENLYVRAWTFTPDSQALVVSHGSGVLSVYSTDTWKEIGRFAFGAHLIWLACHPDGTKVAGTAEDRLEIVDITTGKTTATWSAPRLTCLAFSSDGGTVAAGSWEGQIYLWSTADGERRLSIDAHQNRVAAL